MDITVLDLGRDSRATLSSLAKKYPGARITEIAKQQWKKLGPINLVKEASKIRSDIFLIATDDVEQIQDESMLTILGLLTRSRQFGFFENHSGKIRKISIWRFLTHTVPGSVVSLSVSILFSAIFILLLVFLRLLIRLRKAQIDENYGIDQNLSRVLYLKTAMALKIKVGGSVAHTRGVIEGFHQNGKKILVLSNENIGWLKFENIPVIIVKRIRIFRFFRETERMANGLTFAFRSLSNARQFRPHLIYQRQCQFDVSGLLLSLILRVPLVLESNQSDAKRPYWERSRFTWICGITERVLMNGASEIVAISNPLREMLVELGYPEHRINVIYNGVDVGRFDTESQNAEMSRIREKYGISDEEFLVGFVGTFGQWHGVPTIVKTVSGLAKYGDSIRFLLIGDGEYRQDAQGELQRLGYTDNAIFTGIVEREKMGAYLACCDIFVSPHSKSPDGEKFFGSPTKLFEYMAARRAIIASDLDQIGEVLEHGKTALLVEPDNSEALAKAIIQLKKDSNLRDRLSKNSRELVVNKFTWVKNVENVIGFFN